MKILLGHFLVLATVALAEVTDISAGGSHSCALLTGGAIKCWGWSGDGQLGDGTITDHTSPVDVSGITNGLSLGLGLKHTCAVLMSGAIKCWGSNDSGQRGDENHGYGARSTFPIDVGGIATAMSIALGEHHTCALLTGGAIKCWGWNDYGEIGLGFEHSGYTKGNVYGIKTATSIALGGSHSCALLTGGTIKCWGRNGNGQLGDGTTTNSFTPVDVSRITDASGVALGSSHSCALLTSGKVMCWGSNGNGQLGDGTTTNSFTPVNGGGSRMRPAWLWAPLTRAHY